LALTGLLSVGFVSPSWAILIVGGSFDGTDVGQRDVVEGQGPKVNGEQAELDFVNGVLGTAFTSLTKTEDVDWFNTDTAGVIAFQLVSGPGNDLVKNATSIVLLRNLANINWGVLDLADVSVDLNLGSDMQISHVSEFGGAVQVPEPTVLSLFGLGLIALGLRRRRQIA
jgi:hypothetical protein